MITNENSEEKMYNTKLTTELITLYKMCEQWSDKSQLAKEMLSDIEGIYNKHIVKGMIA